LDRNPRLITLMDGQYTDGAIGGAKYKLITYWLFTHLMLKNKFKSFNNYTIIKKVDFLVFTTRSSSMIKIFLS
jgi:hypothetical protein